MLMKPILEVRNLTKIYEGGVLANHEVNFSVEEGEIHALVGENGAGKSTLMKMLYGMESVILRPGFSARPGSAFHFQ